MQRVFVGLTGASGHAYALALVRALRAAGLGVDLCVTNSGRKVLHHELGLQAADAEALARAFATAIGQATPDGLAAYDPGAIEAPASSGTARLLAVVLCPASMGTVARVAAGFSSNLVERAADVALKEGRPLIVVPREAPLSVLHLENLLKLARLGSVILPAAPGFYHHPRSIDDLVEHIVGKVLDRLGIEGARTRWRGELEPPSEAGTESPGGRAAP